MFEKISEVDFCNEFAPLENVTLIKNELLHKSFLSILI